MAVIQPMLVQNFTFPGSICRKCALDWSLDNKIAVCTNKCVYVLNSYCSPVETGFPLPVHKQVIPAPTATLDFGLFANVHPKGAKITFPDPLYEVVLDHTCVPSKTPHFVGYRCAKWGPKGSGEDGSCLLATLTMDHRLVLHKEKNREWEQVADLSQVLYEFHKSAWEEELASNPKAEIIPSYDSFYNEKLMKSTVARTKQRAYNLAAIEITWTNLFGTQPSASSESSYRWCYLIVAMKSGRIVWWKVSPDDAKIITLDSEWDTDLGVITALSWQQVSAHGGFLLCGTAKGQLSFTPVVVEQHDNDAIELVNRQHCLIWEEQDQIMVDSIAVLKTSLKRFIIVAAKQNFFLFCEISITEGSTSIKNIGQCAGLHKLPVTGIAVVDSALPQSHVLISTMDGLVMKVKVTPKQNGIEFMHEVLDLDLDLENNMVQGLGVSANGLLSALILNTSVMFDHLLKREPLQFVSFLNKSFSEVFGEFSHILKPQFVFMPSSSKTITSYVDYLECVRINLASDSDMPELFGNFLQWDASTYERLSEMELYFLRFLLKCFVSGLAKTAACERKDLEEKLQAVECIIMRNYISKIVSSCHDKVDLLTPAQGQSLLLMADWLYMQYRTPVHNLYEAFGYECPMDVESIPARETCRICQLPVKLENTRYGECERKHKFGRCCQSLILCDTTPYYQCLSCKSMALEDVWSNKFICTYCSFPMTQ